MTPQLRRSRAPRDRAVAHPTVLRPVARYAAILSAAASCIAAQAAFAQTQPSTPAPASAEGSATDSGEIVVTAQRVAEPLSKAPVTVSALGGAELSRRNITSLEDFTGSIPGLQVNAYVGQARTNIRGIGQNSLSLGVDSQIAYEINGVFVGQSFSAAEGFLDLERVEVLRGPQGTLYGRNATGGVINLITAKPKNQFEGYAEVTVGNYNALRTEGMVSGPLFGENVLVRLVGSTDYHKGYSLNLFNHKRYDDSDQQSLRGTVLVNPEGAVTLTVVGDYHHQHDDSVATHLFQQTPGFPDNAGVVLGGHTIPLDANGVAINPRLLNINTRPNYRDNSGGVMADLTWQVSDEISLKSLTAYRYSNVGLTQDFDQTETAFPGDGQFPGADLGAVQKSKQFNQEFQFSGDLHWLKWVTGLYYFHNKIDPGFYSLGINVAPFPAFPPFVVPLTLGGTSETDAYAAFGQFTLQATDKLALIAGLRYSHEKRKAMVRVQIPPFGLDNTQFGKVSFNDLSPKFTISYQADPSLLLYATVSKGFQSGGFDISADPNVDPTRSDEPVPHFDPETIWAYEAGIKYRNAWLSADLSAFHYDYTNLQVAQINAAGLPQTANAASSKINGVELAATLRPTHQFSLSTSLAYLDAKFDKYCQTEVINRLTPDCAINGVPSVDLHGNQVPGAAKYSVNMSAHYEAPIGPHTLSLNGEWNWRSRIYFSEFNYKFVSQPDVSTFNASIRFTPESNRFFVEVFGKNLSNELIAVEKHITGVGFGSMTIGHLAPPRTYGARVHVNF